MAGQACGQMGDRALALFGAIALAVGEALGWGAILFKRIRQRGGRLSSKLLAR
jgi:hypothetical protein